MRQEHLPYETGPIRVLGEFRLKHQVTEHSGQIGFPIESYVERAKEKEVTDSKEDEVEKQTRTFSS